MCLRTKSSMVWAVAVFLGISSLPAQGAITQATLFRMLDRASRAQDHDVATRGHKLAQQLVADHGDELLRPMADTYLDQNADVTAGVYAASEIVLGAPDQSGYDFTLLRLLLGRSGLKERIMRPTVQVHLRDRLAKAAPTPAMYLQLPFEKKKILVRAVLGALGPEEETSNLHRLRAQAVLRLGEPQEVYDLLQDSLETYAAAVATLTLFELRGGKNVLTRVLRSDQPTMRLVASDRILYLLATSPDAPAEFTKLDARTKKAFVSDLLEQLQRGSTDRAALGARLLWRLGSAKQIGALLRAHQAQHSDYAGTLAASALVSGPLSVDDCQTLLHGRFDTLFCNVSPEWIRNESSH